MFNRISILTIALIFGSSLQWSGYQYGYQTYPDRTQHSHPYGHPGATPVPGPNSDMSQLIMSSLLNPAANPSSNLKGSDFLKAWNEQYGYSMTELGAVQENIACRTKCRRMEQEPVCGDYNMTRYFNSCDAECDQVTFNKVNLRYDDKCCCTEAMMSLEVGNLVCVAEKGNISSNSDLKLVLNQCLANCLTKTGDELNQRDIDEVVSC